jgi:hypothetical protein
MCVWMTEQSCCAPVHSATEYEGGLFCSALGRTIRQGSNEYNLPREILFSYGDRNKDQCCKKGYPIDSSADSLGRGRIYFGTVESHHRIVKPTVPIGEKAPATEKVTH